MQHSDCRSQEKTRSRFQYFQKHTAMQATDSLQELTVFLQKNSGKILNGHYNLALTCHTLAHLNRCFKQCEEESFTGSGSHDRHQSHDERWPQMVMFLRSYVKKTPALKLVHPSSTLRGQVEISRFKDLTMLEIKKVPVHMLNGLGCLRHQLQVLSCSRCVQSLQVLLCSCGGDMVSEAPWSSLHTLNLSYNYIDHLDDSLRFLPVLKMLDLSHNELKHTRDYLECLSELAHLNLGYNHLERVPTLGLVARTNLQTLVLRNNSLDNLSGLEDYSSLLELDLCNNCLYEGAELRTLGYLHNLREVNLLGNPLAFDPAYRSVVISNFPSEGSTRKMYLDGVPLTSTENQQIPRTSLTKPVLRIPSQASLDTTSSNVCNDGASLDESSDQDKGRRSKGKRAPKVRQVTIPDQGMPKDNAKSKVSILRPSDIEDTKREMEKMRQLHGPDWLLALQAPYRQSPAGANETETETKAPVEHASEKPKADRGNSLGPGSSGITSDIDSTVNGNVIVHASADGSRHIDTSANGTHGVTEQSGAAPSADVFLPDEKADLQRVSTEQIHVLLEHKNSKPSIFLERLASDTDAAFDSPWMEGTPEEEEHELCSPLLVTVQESNLDAPVHLFLTVRETHIEERNLNGHVTERLEIKCLRSMQESLEPVWNEEAGVNDLLPVINLTFDYMRRDRKKREYILEDTESFKILKETLRPFVEENRLAATTQKAMFQCLKCSTEFAGNQANRKLPAQQGTIRGSYNSEGEGSSVCPCCDSELVVELESPATPSNQTSVVSTPTGSLNSLEMNLKPTATSSPWKLKDKDFVFLSSTERSRSGSSTEYHSAANSLSSSPGQGTAFGQALSSSSSGTSTLVNSSSLIATSKIKRERHITEESIDDNGSAETAASDQDTVQEGNFTLPDPTIRMSRGDETDPLENIPTYQHDKLRELLQENIAPFSQKYSLVPPDILDGVSSKEVSGATTPTSGVTPKTPLRSEMDNAGNSPEERIDRGTTVQSHEESARTKAKSNSVTTLKQHRNDTPVQSHSSRPCSEDDIVILPAEKSNHERLEVTFNSSHDSARDVASSDAVGGVGRAGSTDSEIAVLRNNSIDAVSITSDSVFDASLNAAQTNLANALSDAASKPEASTSSQTSTIDEPPTNTENSGVSPGDADDSANPENLDRNERRSPSAKPSHEKTSLSKESSLASSLEASLSLSVARKHSMLDTSDQDFSNVDHRLKLYFSMALFSTKEELACMIKCGIIQFSKSANFSGLVVVSTQNIYIMKISKEESEKPSDWLVKRSQHSIRDLLHIHVGPGSQSFQLDFINEGILYTIVLRDEDMCEAFVSQFERAIQRAALGKKRRFKDVVRDHPKTLRNLVRQVFGESMDGAEPERAPEISLYILAYQKTTKTVKRAMALDLVPISIVVTPSDLFLAEENHLWPLGQTKTKGQTKMPQFTLREHHRITDVGEVDLYEDSPSDISITFFHEDTAEQSHWHISTENTSSLFRLLDAIQTPWKDMFGVDLKQTIHPACTIEEELLD